MDAFQKRVVDDLVHNRVIVEEPTVEEQLARARKREQAIWQACTEIL